MISTKLLGAAVAYHPRLALAFGEGEGEYDIESGILCDQFRYLSERFSDDDGWFWRTTDDLCDDTGLTRRKVREARKRLRFLGVLEEHRENFRHITYYRLNHDRIDVLLDKLPPVRKRHNPEPDIAEISSDEKRHSGVANSVTPESNKTSLRSGKFRHSIYERRFKREDLRERTSNEDTSRPLHFVRTRKGIPERDESDSIDFRATRSARRQARKELKQHPDESFERFVAEFPDRVGGQRKPEAFIYWRGLIKKGVDPDLLIDRARWYNRFCDVTHKVRTSHVMQMGTFLGPRAQQWTEDWKKQYELAKSESKMNGHKKGRIGAKLPDDIEFDKGQTFSVKEGRYIQ